MSDDKAAPPVADDFRFGDFTEGCDYLPAPPGVAGEYDELIKWVREHAGDTYDGNLMNRLATALAAMQTRIAALTEALTPSGDTKAAYWGEFKFPIIGYIYNEETNEMDEVPREIILPWDTIKQIMKAIRARAALKGES